MSAEPVAAHAAQTAPAPAPAPQPAQPRFRRLLPWASLVLGVIGALTMDRGPKRGALVAGAAVLVWFALLALQWVVRVPPGQGARRYLLTAARWSSLLASQSLVQLGLFFALPFFVQAATFDAGHALFLGGLGALSAASLWDPLTERLLLRPMLAPLLPALASFAALTAVLPGLGLSTRASLWSAAVVSGVGAAATAIAGAPSGRRARIAAIALPAVLALPGALLLGAARIVPAAPLRLVDIAIGAQREQRWITDPRAVFDHAPERLFCATAIWSPLGLKDRLFHVWTRDGAFRARIELDIRGGRAGGYRTFSRIGPLGRHPSGTYRCRVETLAGQVLGGRSVRVRAR